MPGVHVPILPNLRILLLVCGMTALRLIVAAKTGLVFDEAYYRIWALAPSFGYYDHAPMVAWWIALGRAVIGDYSLGIRILAPLSAGIGSLLLWRTSALLFDGKIADRAVIFFNAMLVVSLGSIVITPDIPSVFFWGLTLWALAELRKSADSRWWFAVGISAGLGLLSKYSGVFLGAGILVWLIFVPSQRRWFNKWETWVGGLLAIALFTPVLIWNAHHDFVSFAKQLGRTVGEEFNPSHFFELIGVQWLLMTPLIGAFAFIGIGKSFISMRRHIESGQLFLSALSLPFLAYLVLHSLHDRVNGNWPAPLMPAFSILAAWAFEQIKAPRLNRWTIAIGYGMGAILFVEVLHPFLPIEPSHNPAMLTQGWVELGDELIAKQKETGSAWIATGTYEHTGALSFALRGKAEVAQINERVRYGFLPAPDPDMTKKPALFIDWADEGAGFLANHNECYGTAERIGTISRKFSVTIIETFVLYQLTDVRLGPAVYDRHADPSACHS
jgi:4-amino-4-deoxy-L-arabinose transferase-like glycosyltransferase